MEINHRTAGLVRAEPTAQDLALTGDRPTGRLHLGHYVGSIVTRLTLQEICPQIVLIADLQALTDNAGRPTMVKDNVMEVMLDHLACGMDPARTTMCLQSGIPELSELTMLYLNLVGIGVLERNPTVKQEMEAKGMDRSVPIGFLAYPVSQAADVTAFGATLVPVGDDQLPILEVAERIVGTLDRMAGRSLLPMPRPLLSTSSRLPGIDGKGKASKSRGNAIDLADGPDEIRRKVNAMYTDPDHLRASDPGKVDGNVVFAYLDAFDEDVEGLFQLKAEYSAGGVGDMVVKRRLVDAIEARTAPIRTRRLELASDMGHVRSVLSDGTDRAREMAASGLDAVRGVFGLESRT